MLAVTGGSLIAVSGAYTINLTGIPSGGVYDLINYTGANVSGPGTFQLGTAPSGFGYQLQLNTQINQLDLIVAASVTWTGVNNGGAINNSWDTTSASTNWAGGSPVAASRYVDGARSLSPIRTHLRMRM